MPIKRSKLSLAPSLPPAVTDFVSFSLLPGEDPKLYDAFIAAVALAITPRDTVEHLLIGHYVLHTVQAR